MEMTVIIEKEPESATIRGDGYTDLLYRRVITDKATGEVLVRDVVSEIVESAKVAEELARMCQKRPVDQE